MVTLSANLLGGGSINIRLKSDAGLFVWPVRGGR
jgi:hypothetical protein